jgi:hypothetical protein
MNFDLPVHVLQFRDRVRQVAVAEIAPILGIRTPQSRDGYLKLGALE